MIKKEKKERKKKIVECLCRNNQFLPILLMIFLEFMATKSTIVVENYLTSFSDCNIPRPDGREQGDPGGESMLSRGTCAWILCNCLRTKA